MANISRQVTREAARLNRLANLILSESTFNHGNVDTCIVGLGNRMLPNNKLSAATVAEPTSDGWSDIKAFSAKFGVSYQTTEHLFGGQFSEVNRRAQDLVYGKADNAVRRSSASVLRYIAKQKLAGKVL